MSSSRPDPRRGGHRVLVVIAALLFLSPPLALDACQSDFPPPSPPAELVEAVTEEGDGVTVRLRTMTYHCVDPWLKVCSVLRAGDKISLQVFRDPHQLVIRPSSGAWALVATLQRAEIIGPGGTASISLPRAGRELRRLLDEGGAGP